MKYSQIIFTVLLIVGGLACMGFVAYQVINSRSSEDTRGKEVEGVQHLVNMG